MNAAKLAAMMEEVAARMKNMPGLKVAVACNDWNDAKTMYEFLASEERPCTYSVTYFDKDNDLQVYEP